MQINGGGTSEVYDTFQELAVVLCAQQMEEQRIHKVVNYPSILRLWSYFSFT